MPQISSRNTTGGRKPSAVAAALAVAIAVVVAACYFISSVNVGGKTDASVETDITHTSQLPSAQLQEGRTKALPKDQSEIASNATGSANDEAAEFATSDKVSGEVKPRRENSQKTPTSKRQEIPESVVVKVFDNDVENQLEAISKEGYDSIVAPRVNMSDDEILEFLKRPVDIYDDDDDETIVAKERTAEVKAQALKYIADGGTFNQFLRDYAAQVKEGQEMVKDVKDEMVRILHDEGLDAAQAYLDKMNPQLRENGLKEVRISKGTLKMMERRLAREADESAR